MDAILERLERLAALHRGGALSDVEYEAQKARLLAEAPVGETKAGQPPPTMFAPASDAGLSRAWQNRFAFFRAYGSALAIDGATELRKLPFRKANSIRFNIWAFLFGPIYFFFLGLWKRGLSLSGVVAVISIVTEHLFGDDVLPFVGIAEAMLFSMSVNYAYFIKRTEGRDEWNPLADLFNRPGEVRPAADRRL